MGSGSTYRDEDSNSSSGIIGFQSPDFLPHSGSGTGMNSADSGLSSDSIFKLGINSGFDKNNNSINRQNNERNDRNERQNVSDSVGSKLIRNLSLMQSDSNYNTDTKSVWGTNLSGELNYTAQNERNRGSE